MSIIKASGPARGRDAAPLNLDDLAESGNRCLDEARAHARQIVEQAREEAAAVHARAEQEGRQAALEAANLQRDETLAKQLATLHPALRQAIDRLEDARQGWLLHWEQAAIHLAAAMAKRVVRRELTVAPDIPLALVTEALELAAGSPEIELHLHPEDHAALGRQVGALVTELSRAGKSKIVPDPQISRGGCRLETRFGAIDQQFEAQLNRIEEELS